MPKIIAKISMASKIAKISMVSKMAAEYNNYIVYDAKKLFLFSVYFVPLSWTDTVMSYFDVRKLVELNNIYLRWSLRLLPL